jgi:hypothetical protein
VTPVQCCGMVPNLKPQQLCVGTCQFVLCYSLLLCRYYEESEYRQNSTVHSHRHGHFVQRDAVCEVRTTTARRREKGKNELGVRERDGEGGTSER